MKELDSNEIILTNYSYAKTFIVKIKLLYMYTWSKFFYFIQKMMMNII